MLSSNLVHVLSRSCHYLLSIISIVHSIIWFRHPGHPGNARIKAEFADPTLRPASTIRQFSLHQCQTSTVQLDNFQSLFPFSHLQTSTPTPFGKSFSNGTQIPSSLAFNVYLMCAQESKYRQGNNPISTVSCCHSLQLTLSTQPWLISFLMLHSGHLIFAGIFSA